MILRFGPPTCLQDSSPPQSLNLANNCLATPYRKRFEHLSELVSSPKLKWLSLENNGLTAMPGSLGPSHAHPVLCNSCFRCPQCPQGTQSLGQCTLFARTTRRFLVSALNDPLPRCEQQDRVCAPLYEILLFSSSHPPAISELRSLLELDLSSNKLRHLPASFGGIPVITTLNLSHNDFHELPTSVCALQTLRTLRLSHNAIKKLPLQISGLKVLGCFPLRDSSTSLYCRP